MERGSVESLESRALLVGDASGAITGTAFLDVDNDGTIDTNEPKLGGVTLTLTGRTTTGVDVDSTVTTKADGTFTFQNVLPGTYSLTAEASENNDTIRISPTFSNLVVMGGQTLTRNFGFAQEAATQFLSIRAFRTSAAGGDARYAYADAGTTDTQVNTRENNAPTLLNGAPAAIEVSKNAADQVIDLAGVFDDPDVTDSLVRFKTTVGSTNRDIDVTLLDTQAPQTVANFFNYVTSNRYDNTFFHELISGTKLQGGGFQFNDTANTLTGVVEDSPIKSEFDATNRSNVRGTLAMSIDSGAPDSATSEFFFNLGNNATTQNNGQFTVFGRVESGSLDELDALAGTTVRDQSTANAALGSIPLNSYSGANDDPAFLTAATPANFVRINDVEIRRRDEFLTYSIVSNSNDSLVDATLKDNRLTLDYTPNATGMADIVVRATDRFGATTQTTFHVNVANRAPTATVTLTPANPAPGTAMTATATRSDPDSDNVTLTYTWTVDGTVVKTTSNTTNLTDSLTLANNLDEGDIVRVTVTPNDGTVDGTVQNATTLVNRTPTLINGTPAPIQVSKNAPNQDIDLAGVFTDADLANSLVRLKTTVGTTNRDIDLTLFDAQAPRTVANFYSYITNNRYDDTFFHRSVNSPLVLQGGGFKFNGTTDQITNVATFTESTVANEVDFVNRSNVRGTIAMAKSTADNATSQFYFNVGDNSTALNSPTNSGGFTVFGRVETGSLDELDALAGVTRRDQSNSNSALTDIPLNNYSGPNDDPNFLTTATPENFVRINDVEILRRDEFLTYSIVENTNPSLVTATLANNHNNRLILDYDANAVGTANITIRATDHTGAHVDTTFHVEVLNTPPSITNPVMTPAHPTDASTLQASVTPTDPDVLQTLSFRYVWKIDGTEVKDETTSSTTNTLNLLGQTVTAGNLVSVEVTPNDGLINGTPKSASIMVESNTAPVINSLTLTPPAPTTSSVLTANVSVNDINGGQAVTLKYRWLKNGTDVLQQHDTPNLSDTLDLSAFAINIGDEISVEVTPNDGFIDGMTESESVTIPS